MADVDCGLSSIKGRKAKVVNGEETFEGEFPWYRFELNYDSELRIMILLFYFATLFQDGLASGSPWRAHLRWGTHSQEMGFDSCSLYQARYIFCFIFLPIEF